MTLIRLTIFTLLVPGTIAWWVPSMLSRRWPAEFDIGPWNYIGILFILIGAVLYLRSALAFLIEGKGTPAIWFTKPISFLLGEEPSSLVSGAFYVRTRNPMYIGVILTVAGEAIMLQRVALAEYAVVLLLFFHLVVVFVEEPHLKKKFGQPYTTYLSTTPRWFSFTKKGR